MAIELWVTLPGGKRVDALVGGHVVRTDQPLDNGGEDTAPSPFQLFLAAIGTCAGIFVQGFCAKRGLPTEGIRIVERPRVDPETGVLRLRRRERLFVGVERERHRVQRLGRRRCGPRSAAHPPGARPGRETRGDIRSPPRSRHRSPSARRRCRAACRS